MTAIATQIFDFLEQHPTCEREKHVISMGRFSTLRRHFRDLINGLRDDADQAAEQMSFSLRSLLFELLTTPIPFDDHVIDALRNMLGDPNTAEARLGQRVHSAYEGTIAAILSLKGVHNLFIECIQERLMELDQAGKHFKIYCHPQARSYFESLAKDFVPPLDDATFLHSAADYRKSLPCAVLLKAGPLRSGGWGHVPDAIITAPRYSKLTQVVWSGCEDEPGFGYDPVRVFSGTVATPETAVITGNHQPNHETQWSQTITEVDDGSSVIPDPFPDIDELQSYRQEVGQLDSRRAVLVQISGSKGVLFPPQAGVLSFDPGNGGDAAIGLRRPGGSFAKGMFLILPSLANSGLGGLHAQEGRYSREWKERLRRELQINADAVSRHMSQQGVRLLDLPSALARWAEPATAVIHAPQHSSVFKVLIEYLNMQWPPGQRPSPSAEWWRYAWHEICQSRGVAIQTGQHAHDIIDDKLLQISQTLLPSIRSESADKPRFFIPIPAGLSLEGSLLFAQITSVEEGFQAPNSIFQIVRDLPTFEQWRV